MMNVIRTIAHHNMRLMRVFLTHNDDRVIAVCPLMRMSCGHHRRFFRHVCGGFGEQFDDFVERNIPVNEENGILRPIKLLRKALRVGRHEGTNRIGCAQNIMAKRMTMEDGILEIIVYQIGRRVVITLDFIANHLLFSCQFRLRISAVKHNVRQYVDGSGNVFFQNSHMIDRIFLVGKGVKVATHALQTVDDVP